MKRGLLITLPKSDIATEYLAVFSKPIIEECKSKRIKLRQLKHKEATKENFEENLKKLNYNLIVFNGHGEEDIIRGYDNKSIIELGENEHLLTNRITYARFCWAASKIGKSCMDNNTDGCFIGYNSPFMFLMNTSWSANPVKDKTAKIFFNTSNIIPLEIIKGHSASKSHEKSKKSMLNTINKSITKGDNESISIAETLWNNYNAQVLIGNPDAVM